MRKIVKIKFFLTLFGMLFTINPIQVSARNIIEMPKGLLVTDNNGVSLTKSNGYFFNISDVYPGDKISREIEVKNTRNEEVGLSVQLIPLKVKGPINLIKKMDMKWIFEEKIIFEGNLVNEDKDVYKTGTDIYLGKIPANSTQIIMVELSVNSDIPLHDFLMGESEAIVRWDIKAVADGGDLPETSTLTDETLNKGGRLPSTGEKKTELVILFLLSLALGHYVYNKQSKRIDT